MNIIAVDDEQSALNILEKAIRKAVPDCSVAPFTTAAATLDYAKEVKPDVAFLDIDMAEMNGLTLAKRLKDIHGKTNIIFVTGYSEYTGNAINLRASGYIMKPATVARIIEEIENLRNPVIGIDLQNSQHAERVRIKCFGNFTVFVNGEPLAITRNKPKELLAYLVHKNGSFCRTAEIAAALWEDTASNENMRQVKSRMMKILKDAGIEDIILSEWDSMAVDVKKISCDYYDFLNKKTNGVNAYTGEYMSEYSWAEFSLGYLDNRIN